MGGYQQLVGHVVKQQRGSVSVETMSRNLTIRDATWQFPTLFVEVTDNLVVCPVVDTDGSSIVYHLDQWVICQFNPVAALPIVSKDMPGAVTTAQAFHADPGISFAAGREALLAWSNDYLNGGRRRRR